MLCMSKVGMRDFGIARLITILIVLLFAPWTASATDPDAHASDHHSAHAAAGDHCVNHCLGTGKRLGSPAETPLHCHLKSPQAQASGLSQVPAEGDLPLPALNVISPPIRESATRLSVTSTNVPIPAPPRFILFGNFRS